jgi:structural maintenance of chromosome 3 (chondroitin sulfate proteoglycan 6)
MNVKVNLGTEHWSNIQDLSGGEKSIVSLSLLFALNSLTPSMVFLLDEVDCALDKVYRQGLTRLLEMLNKEQKIQFFITTFREELVETTDKVFLVSFRNG